MRLPIVALYFLAASYGILAAASANSWTAAKVIGLRLTLIDATRVDEYRFMKNYVIPTVSSYDIVINPLWHWKIHEGRLQIYSESQLEDELTLISMDSKTITVRRRAGAIARYWYSYRR